MIRYLKVTNHLDQSLTMDLARPKLSGLAVRDIDGLGTVKANISSTDAAGLDGSMFNSSRANKRNIVLQLGYIPFPDIETSRLLTYKYFPLQRPIRLEMGSDHRTVYVNGRVEHNTPDIFSPLAGCQISVVCLGSYLYDVTPSVTVFSSVTQLFEFPFYNDHPTDPLIEFSSLTAETEKSVIYEGDAPVGMLITIHASGPASNIMITDSDTLESIFIDSALLIAQTGDDIHEGDEIRISTVKGDKYARLIRDGQTINILNVLGDDPAWFQLERGDNLFAYTATVGLENLEFQVYNEIAYEGT